MMAAINFDTAAKESARDPNARAMFEMLNKTVGGNREENLKRLAAAPAKAEQPFVSPLAWAYYSAYQSIILYGYLRAHILQIGMENPGRFFSEEPIKNLLK